MDAYSLKEQKVKIYPSKFQILGDTANLKTKSITNIEIPFQIRMQDNPMQICVHYQS